MNATNIRDEFLRDFKHEFKQKLVTMLKKAQQYGEIPSQKDLKSAVKKVYMSTAMREHVDEEGMRDEVIDVAVNWLRPIVGQMKTANARSSKSLIKEKFLKRSFLRGHTKRVNRSPPRATVARGITLSKNTMGMGALSRALNDLF